MNIYFKAFSVVVRFESSFEMPRPVFDRSRTTSGLPSESNCVASTVNWQEGKSFGITRKDFLIDRKTLDRKEEFRTIINVSTSDAAVVQLLFERNLKDGESTRRHGSK